MRDGLILASTLGAATGIRSTAGLAALGVGHGLPSGRRLKPETVRRAAVAAYAGESIADKLLPLPDRTDPLPLIGRVVLAAGGAVLAASCVDAPHRIAALAGSATAVATAWLATRGRAAARARGLPDAVPAILEDLVVIGLAAHAIQGLSRGART